MDKSLKAITMDGSNVVFKLDGCHDLPAKMYEDDGFPIIETAWELSDEQIERLIETKQISIAVIGKSIQPISVQVV